MDGPDATEWLDESGELITAPSEPIPAIPEPVGPTEPAAGPSVGIPAATSDPIQDISALLAAEKQWLENQKALQELKKIQDLRARIEAGEDVDLTTPHIANTRGQNALFIPGSARNDVRLPDPEKPVKFSGKDKMEYDSWVRRNEAFHHASSSLTTEEQKVEFSVQFLSMQMEQAWHAYVIDSQLKDPHWKPTWDRMKQFALQRLGPEWERRQVAWVRAATMRQDGKHPTVLLNELRILWNEAGLADEKLQIMSYIAALDSETRRKVLYENDTPSGTLSQAEERAIKVYHLLKMETSAGRPKRPQESKQSRSDRSTSPRDTASQKPKKRANNYPRQEKKPKVTSSTPARDPFDKKGGKTPNAICYNCGKANHISTQCTAEKIGNGSTFRPDTSGKDKATKS
jgi:hypothetical protein